AGVARAQAPDHPDRSSPSSAEARAASLAPPSLAAPSAPPSMQPPRVPLAQGISAPTLSPGDKNPATASGLAVLGATAGIGMMAMGVGSDSPVLAYTGLAAAGVGPSLGHFYAGESGRALTHSAARVGSVGVILAGGLWLFSECFSFSSAPCDPSPGPPLMIGAGVVAGISSAVYSIYDAPRAARRQNTRARRLVITPAP